jgi:hypothetical protein
MRPSSANPGRNHEPPEPQQTPKSQQHRTPRLEALAPAQHRACSRVVGTIELAITGTLAPSTMLASPSSPQSAQLRCPSLPIARPSSPTNHRPPLKSHQSQRSREARCVPKASSGVILGHLSAAVFVRGPLRQARQAKITGSRRAACPPVSVGPAAAPLEGPHRQDTGQKSPRSVGSHPRERRSHSKHRSRSSTGALPGRWRHWAGYGMVKGAIDHTGPQPPGPPTASGTRDSLRDPGQPDP